ncbi:MAG: Crp/Fnr family transcriptional regulator [Gammaproteobacteria bacterium]|nr:Crp/Fnr family transcriptional regulator [Gammaproteobacteria bacterium]
MPIEFKEVYLFSQLNEQQLASLRQGSRQIALTDGQALFQLGDRAKSFYVVKSGKIKLSRLGVNGNEKVIEVVMPGKTFAEALMFSDQPAYPVAAHALGKSEVVAFESSRFLAMLSDSPQTCFRLMGEMSMRLHALLSDIDTLSLRSATERVASYLCQQQFINGKSRISFELDTPKGVLASLLSIKPETLSRIFHSLAEEKIIEVNGQRIDIIDPESLKNYVHASGICPYGSSSR